MSDGFSVRGYQPGDEHVIVELMKALFRAGPSLDWWRWQFQDAPGGPALIHLLEHDGRVVGHHAHVGFGAFVDGRVVRMCCGGPLVVMPEFRGRGGMGRLVGNLEASDHGFALRASFPYERAAVLARRHGVGPHLGRIPRFIRWLSTDAPSRGHVRMLVRSGAMGLYSAAASWPAPRVVVEPLDEIAPELDELAAASATFARCIRVRDAAYLRWRWRDRPGTGFMVHGARASDGALRGFVVSGTDGGRRGRIVDVLARDADTLRALLLHAVDTLTAMGCTQAILDYLDPRPWARRAVLRSGFVPWGEGINVIAASLSAEVGSTPEQLVSWYLTAGDTERL